MIIIQQLAPPASRQCGLPHLEVPLASLALPLQHHRVCLFLSWKSVHSIQNFTLAARSTLKLMSRFNSQLKHQEHSSAEFVGWLNFPLLSTEEYVGSSHRCGVCWQRSIVTSVFPLSPLPTQWFNHGSRQQLRGWLPSHISYVCAGRGLLLFWQMFCSWCGGSLDCWTVLDLLCRVSFVCLFVFSEVLIFLNHCPIIWSAYFIHTVGWTWARLIC